MGEFIDMAEGCCSPVFLSKDEAGNSSDSKSGDPSLPFKADQFVCHFEANSFGHSLCENPTQL